MEVSRRKRFSYYQSAVKAAQKDYNSTVANILGNDDVDPKQIVYPGGLETPPSQYLALQRRSF